jgi:O-antigen ligase
MPDVSASPSFHRIRTWLGQWRPGDALLPIIILLHLYKATRDTSLGLLVIWMAWRLTLPLIERYLGSDRRGPVLSHVALFLGLLLVNARPIALRDDIEGPTQFLVIALGFVLGTLLVQKAWRATFAWLALSAILLIAPFLQEAFASGGGLPFSFEAIERIYSSTMRGYGGISRFATLALILTICSWYLLLLSRSLLTRSLGLAGVISGYILCLGSGSRTSVVAAPMAAALAWVVLRLKGRSRKLKLLAALLPIAIPLAWGLWWFVLSPEAARNRISDYNRMAATRCWLSIMFSGDDRFLFGIGYGSEKPNQICYHIPDFRGELGTIGHAHSTFAQMGGQHGILGILALLILVTLVVLGLRRQLSSVQGILPLGPGGTTWAEASLGINLALALNAIATTIHIANHMNQMLIGLLAATALSALKPPPLDSSDEPSPLSPAKRSPAADDGAP